MPKKCASISSPETFFYLNLSTIHMPDVRITWIYHCVCKQTHLFTNINLKCLSCYEMSNLEVQTFSLFFFSFFFEGVLSLLPLPFFEALLFLFTFSLFKRLNVLRSSGGMETDRGVCLSVCLSVCVSVASRVKRLLDRFDWTVTQWVRQTCRWSLFNFRSFA